MFDALLLPVDQTDAGSIFSGSNVLVVAELDKSLEKRGAVECLAVFLLGSTEHRIKKPDEAAWPSISDSHAKYPLPCAIVVRNWYSVQPIFIRIEIDSLGQCGEVPITS